MIFENCGGEGGGGQDRSGDRGKFLNNAYLNYLKLLLNMHLIHLRSMNILKLIHSK